jgi:uncharacterized membrane protein
MTWIQRHRLRAYVSNSIGIGPTFGIAAGIVVSRLSLAIDREFGWTMPHHVDAVRTVLITLASCMFSFVVFLASALLIAVQLASAQMTPRIIGLVFRDRTIKVAMTLFVTALTLSVSVVLHMRDQVPALTVRFAAYSCVVGLVVFLYLVSHIGRILRPSKALRTVARLGQNVIESVYPRLLADLHADGQATPRRLLGERASSIPSNKDGVILAFNTAGIVALARRADCVLELVPQVGDFVAFGTPLFNIYGDTSRVPVAELTLSVAIGQERSMEQDPAFAFRIMVDIACKALSPAINDPTTAVLAIDQIHHLLRKVGMRYLEDERIRDEDGRLRLLYRTPGWEDFVHLAATEIRHYGCQSMQVNRRLHAMFQSLMDILPAVRRPALQRELELLNRTAIRSFSEPEDREMAAHGDSQGMGGETNIRATPATPASLQK